MTALKRRSLIIGCVLSAALAVGAWVHAGYDAPDSPDFTPMTVPYQGVLERDGYLVNGTGQFRLSLWDSEQDGARTWGPEVHEDVVITDGRFSFVIGSATSLSLSAIESTPVYLAIEVRLSDIDTDWVALSGRQRLHSSPYAIRAYRAMYAEHAAEAEESLDLPDIHQDGTNVGLRTTTPKNSLTISGDGAVGGLFPTWLTDGSSRGMSVHWGSDNAFFGLKNRAPGDSNSKDTVVYFGDDWNDRLIFESRSYGEQLTMDASGNVTLDGSLNIDGGNLYVGNDKPVVLRRFNNIGTGTTDYNTGYSYDTWSAAIAGFDAYDGDINENKTGNPIVVRVIKGSSGNWHIKADFRSHDNHEEWHADVLFIRNELVRRVGY